MRNIMRQKSQSDLFIQKFSCLLFVCCLLFSQLFCGETVAFAQMQKEKSKEDIQLDAKSAVLMEGSTGTILYEKNKEKQLPPASITKIMTLLLAFEALESGKISLTDEVSVSEHAASMGGSQVYLEPNETQTVETMIKCISIASANDAAVAMAEYIAGSEEAFVAAMNARAKQLGMNHTHFVNCCGLDVAGHYSCANDIAIMSRELICKHPKIKKYTTVWMDQIVHKTRKGETEFGLTNTNKLVKTYHGITGLKTGSTSQAKFCLSATANRNQMDLIAVVMSAPGPKERFAEAAKLLDYGFAQCRLYLDTHEDVSWDKIPVKGGQQESVCGIPQKAFSYVCMQGISPEQIQKKMIWKEKIEAPIQKGDVLGEIVYQYQTKKIGNVKIIAQEAVPKAGYMTCMKKVLQRFLLKK